MTSLAIILAEVSPPENDTDFLGSLVERDFLIKLAGALLILVVGFFIVSLLSRSVKKFATQRISPQGGMVARKIVAYLGYLLLCIMVLKQFGIELGAILGAAGILTIAVGFAAQTSLSNIISGLFLIGEKPFTLGDIIEVEGITGSVDTIGLLSLTLRTFDNRSVRIPNETLVKTKVINISRHPIRRYDLQFGVAYDEDIDQVLRIMREVAEKNLYCLDEPQPLLAFDGFGDSSLNFHLGGWCEKGDYIELKNTLPKELKEHFDRENIEIPFPHVTLANGKAAIQPHL